MMKILFIVITWLAINMNAKTQDLFLIGEKSYLCTSVIKLKSNSNDRNSLDVYFVKDSKSGLFAVSKYSLLDETFTDKLIIFLKDGNVITCAESVESERVDNLSKALYNLTTDQLNKLKASNIHTVKYTLYYHGSNNYSASNKEIETSKIASGFFID